MNRPHETPEELQATFERLVEHAKARGYGPDFLARSFRAAYGYWPKGFEPIATNAKGGDA